MKNQRNCVDLISFLPQYETNSICEGINTLNYQVRLIESKQWIENGLINQSQLSVIALPSSDVKYEKIYQKIQHETSTFDYLVLFCEPINDSFLPIVTSCQECCRWPCEHYELTLRLNRLSAKVIAKAETADLARQTHQPPCQKKWTDLNLVGSSSIFVKTLAFIEDAANCDAPVLIEGETGTGKEMAARGIHYRSLKNDYPFIPVNCGAIPDNLIENELFGHEKGAYTDAKQCQPGLIEQADGGTLFLDEIEALSAKGQVALLRFLEEHKIKPLGGKIYKDVNVRIITATNEPISELVNQGSFRQDLMFRLNLLHLKIPPLRERTSDIQSLASHFIEKFRIHYQTPEKKLSVKTVEWMNRHPWPGNVRELENFIHKQFILNEDIFSEERENLVPTLERRKLIDRRLNFALKNSFNEAKQSVINRFEEQYLTDLMKRTNGNVSQAAKDAQKERRALGKLLVKNNINPSQFRNKTE